MQLGALLHDIADWKYHAGDESVGPTKAKEFLLSQCYDAAKAEEVANIVRNVSFHTELGGAVEVS